MNRIYISPEELVGVEFESLEHFDAQEHGVSLTSGCLKLRTIDGESDVHLQLSSTNGTLERLAEAFGDAK